MPRRVLFEGQQGTFSIDTDGDLVVRDEEGGYVGVISDVELDDFAKWLAEARADQAKRNADG